MNFTISKKADKKISQDMEVIIREIRKTIPGVLSIILTGAFSRGEGPFKIEKNKIYLYNDYDIQVVTNKDIEKENIDRISTLISEILGYKGIKNFYPFKKENQKMKENFYIDLKVDSVKNLRRMLNRIRTIELRNYSRILYGKDLRNLIPDYKIRNIPKTEGAKLLLDRMSQMIEYYSTENKHDKEFLCYIIQQAYAAICTSLLLISGKYEIGYLKSMKIFKESYKRDFPELYEKIKNLDKKIEEYTLWKINPRKLPKNLEEEWFIAKNNLIEVAKYFFSRNKKIENIEQLSQTILTMKFHNPYIKEMIKNKIGINSEILTNLALPFADLYLKLKYFIRLQGKGKISIFYNRSPDLIIFSSMPFLLESISKNRINKEYLLKGKEILSRVYDTKGRDWEDISLDYANAYIAFFLQKI